MGDSLRLWKRRSAGRRLALLLSISVSGCVWAAGGGHGLDDPEARYERAEIALEDGRFADAFRDLRSLAERCGSGRVGREAVLLLASQEIDPRNPARTPQAAAQLAARLLQSPSASRTSLVLAESIYLNALELGAEVVRDPFAPLPLADEEAATEPDRGHHRPSSARSGKSWNVAPRFQDCGEVAAPLVVRALPLLPAVSLRGKLTSLEEERTMLLSTIDSLEFELATTRSFPSLAAKLIRAHLKELEIQRDGLRAEVDSLASELERVRGLIQSGPARRDTAQIR